MVLNDALASLTKENLEQHYNPKIKYISRTVA